jgi:hypothetical protein
LSTVVAVQPGLAVGTGEGRTAEGRTAEGRTAEGRTAEGRTAEGRTAEGRTGLAADGGSVPGASPRVRPAGQPDDAATTDATIMASRSAFST